jgi:hypothetical protein
MPRCLRLLSRARRCWHRHAIVPGFCVIAQTTSLFLLGITGRRGENGDLPAAHHARMAGQEAQEEAQGGAYFELDFYRFTPPHLC